MADEKIRLVLDVAGIQDVAQAKAQFEDLAQALGIVDFKFEQLGDASKGAAEKLTDLGNAADDASGASGGPGARRPGQGGGRPAGGAGGGAGRGLMGLGYALQDLAQGGWPAIINNVTGLATGLGLGAGLAGAAQIAGVALLTMGDSLKDLLKTLDKDFVPAQKDLGTSLKANDKIIDDLTKKIDALAEKAKKTAAEFALLAGMENKRDQQTAEQAGMKAADDAWAKAAGQLPKSAEAQLKEWNEAGMAGLRQPRAGNVQQALEQDMVNRAEAGIAADRNGSQLERLQFLAKQNGVDVTGLNEAQIMDKMRSRFSVVDPETGRTIAEGTNRDVTDAASRASMNNNDFQNMRLARARRDAETESKRLLGIVMGGAKTPQEYLDAYNKLPPPVQKMIDDQLVEARQKEMGDAIGVTPDAATVRGPRAEFDKMLAGAKANRADMAETVDVEEKTLAGQNRATVKANAEARQEAERKANEAERAKERAEKEAQRAEERRVQLRDRVMERDGLTPLGLGLEARNSAPGFGAAAEQQRAATARAQQAELQRRFEAGGMDAATARKTAEEVAKASQQAVAAELRSGNVVVNGFNILVQRHNAVVNGVNEALSRLQAGVNRPGFGGARGMR